MKENLNEYSLTSDGFEAENLSFKFYLKLAKRFLKALYAKLQKSSGTKV